MARKVAFCLVENKAGEVLLVQRGYGERKGKWSLPGGHVDHGERSWQAARRELREETGLRAEIVSTIMKGHCAPIKTFYGRITGGQLRAKLPECSDARFFHYQNLPPLAFDADLRAIKKWQGMKEEHRQRAHRPLPDLCPHCDSSDIALRRYPHRQPYRCIGCKRTLESSTRPNLLVNREVADDNWEQIGGWDYFHCDLSQVPKWVSDQLFIVRDMWKRSGHQDDHVLLGRHYRYVVTFAGQGGAICDIWRRARGRKIEGGTSC